MFASERRIVILKKLNEQKRIIVKDLSIEMNISEATLRMDLSKMEDQGLLQRTHGGAILVDNKIDVDTSFSSREKANKNEKHAIANQAIKLISDGQCIMLDASSTALELVKLLKDREIRLTVVTSGINTALELNEHPDITVIMLGGILRRGSNSLEGNLGIDILDEINIDLLFTSANGFSVEAGLTDFSVYEVQLKKAMVNVARKVIALLDHSKINNNSIASFASIQQINTIITDYDMPDNDLQALEKEDIDVFIVPSVRQ
ncbi:DeoR/GlpR family DNA-binding transcription regulator [Virgibacillus dakarensis]|uniref:DeoR/GlpR family DNA-binding transcription regulator n=1 Tax=Virgibacillus dakarensis TaxID=1917889 RepID=UPI000B44F7C6|nr:DeoR/GlpR family DNA-binding transcription regulator [Virgibacillus dakarensis]